MPRYLHVMQSPPHLVLWSSFERRRFWICVGLEQERRQRPKGRLAALQGKNGGSLNAVSCALAQPSIPPASNRRQAADTARRGWDTHDGTHDDHGNRLGDNEEEDSLEMPSWSTAAT